MTEKPKLIGFPIYKRAARAVSVKNDLEFLTTKEPLSAVIVKSFLCSKVTNYHCLRLAKHARTKQCMRGQDTFSICFGGDRPNQGREPKP